VSEATCCMYDLTIIVSSALCIHVRVQQYCSGWTARVCIATGKMRGSSWMQRYETWQKQFVYCKTSACQRPYTHTRLLVHQSRGHVHQTHADVVEEVRPRKRSYVCNKEKHKRKWATSSSWIVSGAGLLT